MTKQSKFEIASASLWTPPRNDDEIIMYESFLESPSGKNWRKIGLKCRAGVAAPLFSIYSKQSIGIGELRDLKLLADWCQSTGMSIIQLLPMNDVGSNFRPYDAESGFALEPMYLSLDQLTDVDVTAFKEEINSLRNQFPSGGKRVNYKIKSEKLNLLWKIFKSVQKKSSSFGQFNQNNRYWLDDYASFKVLLEQHPGKNWEAWPVPFKEHEVKALADFARQHQERIDFYKWLQWQLFNQFTEVKRQVKKKNILIIGDLPFLASRNSADVWAHQNYFKLDLSSGAPPDAYFANGQRWGTPPCHWEAIETDGFNYVSERLRYAENFYDLLRIDHAVGLFRLWSIPITELPERGGLNGFFDPPEENKWEERGRKLLSVFLKSKMLACAEDLGTVPECSYRVLAELAIPGIDVQRWKRDLNELSTFESEKNYRENSIAMISTHDMTSFNAWWGYEAGTIYEPLFKRQCEARSIDFEKAKANLFDLEKSKHERLYWKEDVVNARVLAERLNKSEHEIADLINDYQISYQEKQKFLNYLALNESLQEKSLPQLLKAALEKLSSSTSIFSIQLLQDWLALADLFREDPWDMRINFPGTVNDKNWSIVMPISLEKMQKLSINTEIKKINKLSSRK